MTGDSKTGRVDFRLPLPDSSIEDFDRELALALGGVIAKRIVAEAEGPTPLKSVTIAVTLTIMAASVSADYREHADEDPKEALDLLLRVYDRTFRLVRNLLHGDSMKVGHRAPEAIVMHEGMNFVRHDSMELGHRAAQKAEKCADLRPCSCGKPRSKPWHLVCEECWALVPLPLQELVYRLFRTQQGSDDHVAAVRRCFEAIRAGRAGQKVCRVCGCTDSNCQACIQRTGQPCHWVEPDLCSACADGRGEFSSDRLILSPS